MLTHNRDKLLSRDVHFKKSFSFTSVQLRSWQLSTSNTFSPVLFSTIHTQWWELPHCCNRLLSMQNNGDYCHTLLELYVVRVFEKFWHSFPCVVDLICLVTDAIVTNRLSHSEILLWHLCRTLWNLYVVTICV